MPYIEPYIILKVGDKNTAEIRLRNNNESETIKVNVDQLSKCYPELAGQSEIKGKKIRQRYANRPRKGGATVIRNVERAAKNCIASDTSETPQEDEISALSGHICTVNVSCDLKETGMATMERSRSESSSGSSETEETTRSSEESSASSSPDQKSDLGKKKTAISQRKSKRGEQRKERKPKKIEEEKKSATKDTGGKRSGRMKVTPSKEKDREGKQR
ncbi:MAG: hypothetical protein GY821_00335, partial [Gammaproteobacteria bacterium]|nr:hypothetical protein [Gammaproteobacteria bacterium]